MTRLCFSLGLCFLHLCPFDLSNADVRQRHPLENLNLFDVFESLLSSPGCPTFSAWLLSPLHICVCVCVLLRAPLSVVVLPSRKSSPESLLFEEQFPRRIFTFYWYVNIFTIILLRFSFCALEISLFLSLFLPSLLTRRTGEPSRKILFRHYKCKNVADASRLWKM